MVGFSRPTGADEDHTLARLRALRSDLIDPTLAVHRGRVVKRTGEGGLVEFRSVVDAVRCAVEIQNVAVIVLRAIRVSANSAMGNGSRSLGEFPLNVVRIDCKRCDRARSYRRDGLVAGFGPDAAFPDVLMELAS